MNTTLKLQMRDTTNNTSTKSITYANPAASNYVLKNFAVALNGLSNNTLEKIERVDTTDITNATNE